jgi:hypothetical protein
MRCLSRSPSLLPVNCYSAHRRPVPRLSFSLHFLQRLPRLSDCSNGWSRHTKQSFVRNKTGPTGPPCAISSVHAINSVTRKLTCVHNLDTPRWTSNVEGVAFPTTHGDNKPSRNETNAIPGSPAEIVGFNVECLDRCSSAPVPRRWVPVPDAR